MGQFRHCSSRAADADGAAANPAGDFGDPLHGEYDFLGDLDLVKRRQRDFADPLSRLARGLANPLQCHSRLVDTSDFGLHLFPFVRHDRDRFLRLHLD